MTHLRKTMLEARQSDPPPTPVARPSDAAGAGIDEYIRHDPSALGQQTSRLMDSLKLVSVTPRLSAFATGIARRTITALFVLALALFVPFLAFVFVILGLCLLVSALVIVLRVKTTKITLDKGRLQYSSGIFSKVQPNIELYRVEDITLSQTFLQRLTGDGTITLRAATGHAGGLRPVYLCGLAPIGQLREYFEQLRSLVLLLRTGTLGKGVIY